MNKIKKYIYIVIGFISLSLGVIGVLIPVLPTTPFLLVSSFCFMRGSKKIDNWFKNTKIYKKHLEKFVSEKAMTLKQKVTILLIADTMIAIPIILVDNMHVKLMLIAIILLKLYYFTFKIKTIKE